MRGLKFSVRRKNWKILTVKKFNRKTILAKKVEVSRSLILWSGSIRKVSRRLGIVTLLVYNSYG